VLWIAESGAVPSSLVGALTRRGMQIVIAREAPRVMLELAAAGSDDAEAGDAGPVGVSVVFVEPEGRPRIDEMRYALATYFPAVRCWQYQSSGSDGRPRLEAFDLPEAEASPIAHVKTAEHRLRSVVVRAEPRPGPDTGPLVSEEELAMLLGDDPPRSETAS
jgi:hypothetical protein